MLLEWNHEKYATGFAHIDEQHRELFEGLNGLTSFLKNSSPEDDHKNSGKVIEMLDFLGEYAGRHFQDEEAIFDQHNHPMADANKAEHTAFVEKYLEYHGKLTKGTFTRAVLIQLNIFLRSWLIHHIVKVDTALCECAEKMAAESSITAAPAEKKGVFARFLSFLQKR